jgi:diadenosine tetraphosphate (Ap4A) HIT family hydrolase
MTILESKQTSYQQYLENPESNGLRYGSSLMRGQIRLENELCFYLEHETETGGMIIPKALRETVFDLNQDEWNASYELLLQAKALLETELHPDGFNVGWNVSPVGGQHVPIAHLHILPRFADEPFAGRGIRWWIKSSENTRLENK